MDLALSVDEGFSQTKLLYRDIHIWVVLEC